MMMTLEFLEVVRQILVLAALLAGIGLIGTVQLAVSRRGSPAMQTAGRRFAAACVVSFVSLMLALIASFFGSEGGYAYLPILSELAVVTSLVAVVLVFAAVVLLLRGVLAVSRDAFDAAGGRSTTRSPSGW